jgi:hypothetical protein
MIQRKPGTTYTLSALSDKLAHVFETVKREQPYFKLKVICCGDYYYFSFLASIYNQRPLEIKSCDAETVLQYYPNIELPVLQSCIDVAITKFAENNGFGVHLDRMKKNDKYKWVIIQ